MRLLILITLYLAVVPFRVLADETPTVAPFYYHITTPARTIHPGEFAYEPFPGVSGTALFLYNSLSVGITDWLQIGFVPLFALLPDHRFNANFKVNVVKEKYFQLGVGYSHFSIRLQAGDYIQEENGSRTYHPRADLGFAFFAANYRDPSSRFSWGLNYSYLIPTSNSRLVEKVLREQTEKKREWALDLSYQYFSNLYITFGIGMLRAETFELESPLSFGYGFSATILRDTHWFPRVTSGIHYSPSIDDTKLLISFDL